jgi:iron complex outermembrane receptor protein
LKDIRAVSMIAIAAKGPLSVAGYVKNLTNKTYYPFGIAIENLFGNGYRVRAQPRMFGAELSYHF